MQKYNLQPGTGFIKRRVNLAGQDPIYQQIWDECWPEEQMKQPEVKAYHDAHMTD